MVRQLLLGLTMSLVAIAGRAQDPSQLPKPPKEAAWLQHFVGDWEVEGETVMAPGQPAVKCKGSVSAKSLGGFWVISETQVEVQVVKVSAVFTIGFDPKKKKYIGTWVDSMTDHLWKYEGSFDATEKILTLDAEGPSMLDPNKMSKYKDSYEVVTKDHLILRSTIEGPDGKWTKFMTVNYKRKK